MNINRNRREALPFLRQVLSNDYTCDPDDFLRDGVTINEFVPRPGGRGYLPPRFPFQAATFGNGTVITCHADLIEPVGALADRFDRDYFFFPEGMGPIYTLLHERGLHLRGPSLKHLLTADRFTPSSGFLDRTTLLETEAVLALENTPGFPFSLTMAPGRKISEFLAGAAYDGDRLIAVASACNEVDGLWQIAVDVLPEARGTGLGLAIVSRVTTAILERDGLPYYSAAASNIASRSIARRLGFWPVFTEMFTLESIEH